jgi:hypothetical protein
MSQNHPSEIREAVIEQLEGKGPYSNAALAREMRLASG